MCIQPKLKTGRPSLIRRVFRPFTFKAELDNAYHSNPDLINKTTEEARGVTHRKVTSEEYSRLRSAGSKCIAAWTQGDAYPLMPEWCRSKRTQVPGSLASWMRFVGDGNDGLLGYVKFLMNSTVAPIPGATAPRTCACSDTHLLEQEIETMQATIDEMKGEKTSYLQELAKRTDGEAGYKAKYEAALKEMQYLRRSKTIFKANSAKRAVETRRLKRQLARAKETLNQEGTQRRKRKDTDELKPNGRAYNKRIKEARRVLMPASINPIRDNNKKNGLRKR